MASLGGLLIWLTAYIWHTNAEVAPDRAVRRFITSSVVVELFADCEALGLRPNRTVRLGSRNAVILLAVTLALVALVWRDRVGAVVAVIGPGVTGALTEYVLKPLVNTPSPVGARAFPSGHAGGIAAVAVVAVVLVYRRRGAVSALVLAPLAAIPVVVVGSDLLSLGYHYPTDVAGGILLALLVVVATTAFLARVESLAQQVAAASRRGVVPASTISLTRPTHRSAAVPPAQDS